MYKSVIFHRKDNSLHVGITGETSGALRLNGFFGKLSFMICFLKVQTHLCVNLFFYLLMYIFLSYYFSGLKICQGQNSFELHQSKCENFYRRLS